MTKLLIPRILQEHCQGSAEVELCGSTVRDVLDDLSRQYPRLYQCVCNETGAVRRHINIFVNDTLVRDRAGKDTRLEAGDVVSVFQAVSGG